MNRSTWVQIVGLVLMGLLAYAFYAQNSLRVTQLSLDVGIAAWRLQQPMPVPLLMGLCFAGGVLPVSLWAWWRTAVLRAELRKLRQEVAMGSDSRKDGWR